jgi:hypothetical protein
LIVSSRRSRSKPRRDSAFRSPGGAQRNPGTIDKPPPGTGCASPGLFACPGCRFAHPDGKLGRHTRGQAASAPNLSAATARSMDCSSAPDANRARDVYSVPRLTHLLSCPYSLIFPELRESAND